MKVKRTNGVAGQFSYDVVTDDGERLSFVSDVYGPTVWLVTPSGAQVRVSDPGRFGERLSEEWVRRFVEAG